MFQGKEGSALSQLGKAIFQ